MKPNFRFNIALAFCLSSSIPCVAAPQTAPATKKEATLQPDATSPFTRPLKGEKRFAHLLNRLAFGPRPGDIESVGQIGAGAWIESQLAPQKINDDALESQLANLSWLRESPERLMLAYESDTFGVLRRLKRASASGEAQTIALTPRQKRKIAQIEAAQFAPRASVEALGQLSSDKLARAIDSKRQLQEVLTDFWGNHFNVDVKKGPGRALKIVDDREVIRPHVFGTFRELLGASAHSPAMLFYLDNARSTKNGMASSKNRKGKGGGLNENYARELMELHTLGVEGGYSQKDVTEVARAFTGWSIDQQSGEFLFRAFAHDADEKIVLGQTIAAGGERDGEQVLDLLAKSPATANFIARKLCQRFVADNPPAALVERVAAAFSQSGGDLKTTYRALFFAPEFFSEGAYRAKIKSPLEFTVSSVRALGGSLDTASQGAKLRILASGAASLNGGGGGKNKALQRLAKRPLAAEIGAMGQPLFSCQPPTGYAEDSTKWVSASALVSRLNFALGLTAGRVGDVSLSQDTFRPASVEAMAQSLLNSDLSPATRAVIAAEAQKTPGDGARLRALLLGSPEFQRR